MRIIHCSQCPATVSAGDISNDAWFAAIIGWQLIDGNNHCPRCADAALPTLSSLRGTAPDCTGEMSSVEFVRKLRDSSIDCCPTCGYLSHDCLCRPQWMA